MYCQRTCNYVLMYFHILRRIDIYDKCTKFTNVLPTTTLFLFTKVGRSLACCTYVGTSYTHVATSHASSIASILLSQRKLYRIQWWLYALELPICFGRRRRQGCHNLQISRAPITYITIVNKLVLDYIHIVHIRVLYPCTPNQIKGRNKKTW